MEYMTECQRSSKGCKDLEKESNIVEFSLLEQSISITSRDISYQEGLDQIEQNKDMESTIEDCKSLVQVILPYFLTIVLGEWKSYDDRLVQQPYCKFLIGL